MADIRTRVLELEPTHKPNQRIEALLAVVESVIASHPKTKLTNFHVSIIARTVARLSGRRSSAREWASFARLYVRWATGLFLEKLPEEANTQILRGQLSEIFNVVTNSINTKSQRLQLDEKQLADAHHRIAAYHEEITYIAESYICGCVWQPLVIGSLNTLKTTLAQDFTTDDSIMDDLNKAMQHLNDAFKPQLPAADNTNWPEDVRQAYDEGTNADKALDESRRRASLEQARSRAAIEMLRPTMEGLERMSMIADCLMIGGMVLDLQLDPTGIQPGDR